MRLPCPCVCCSLLLYVCPGFLAGATGSLDATQRCVTPCVSLWGWLSSCASDGIRAQYKHAAADEFPDFMLPGNQTTSPSPFRPQTHRFLHSEELRLTGALSLPIWGMGISAHIPPQTGNPLSPTSAGSMLGWLLGKQGLSGTELSVCSVLGTPWFCPPADTQGVLHLVLALVREICETGYQDT